MSRIHVQYGRHALCHTFVANVTVNLGLKRSDLRIKVTQGHKGWGWQSLSKSILKSFRVMIHDPAEMGLYEDYNIRIPPLYLLSEERNGYRTKVKLRPNKRISLSTKMRPCRSDSGYSLMKCLLACSWTEYLQRVKLLTDGELSCKPLGMITQGHEFSVLPVCNHATKNDSKDESPGYHEFCSGTDIDTFASLDGAYSECHDTCLPRCVISDYQPEEQVILPKDSALNQMTGDDFLIYFDSTEVQIIKDAIAYDGDNLFADMSGITGAALGISIFGAADFILSYLFKKVK